MEIWRDIPGYEGHYQVSNKGKVKSLKGGNEKIIKNNIGNYQYPRVHLRLNGNVKPIFVHVLVAIVFLKHDPKSKNVVDHIDENKKNPTLENLQILSFRENKVKSLRSNLPTGVDKRDKYFRARIRIGKERILLGHYDTPEEASQAYQNKLKEII